MALPEQIAGNLSGRYQRVILFFIDAFGWRFVEKHRDQYPFLQHFENGGTAAKITSQFPSTTSAHVTCIHTGLPVGQSGIYEWQYYEPTLDAIIVPLLHSYAGTMERDTLPAEVDPTSIYPTTTLYQDLARDGVRSVVFQNRLYTPSTYSDLAFQGATAIPYRTLTEALINMARLLPDTDDAPSYIFLYFDLIDAIGHEYGPNSPQLEAEIDSFLTAMERWFWRPLAGRLQDTLLILTADHGMAEVDPATTIYLNRDPRFAGLDRFLKRNRAGELLIPAGSCRDLFLYVHDHLLDEAQDFMATRLAGRAEVHRTRDLIEWGLFGPQPLSPEFLARVGNLVILPFRHESVWWYEKGRFEQKYYGHHGGLTREEMEIPLLLYSFDA